MARKSKETIFYEQMLTLSSCPKDLLNYIKPDGELLKQIELCENGDARALEMLTEELASKYFCSPDRGTRCEAMEYLCTLGAEVGVDACLLRLTEYVCLCEKGFDLLLPYSHMLTDCVAYRRAVIKARIRALAGEGSAEVANELIYLTPEEEAALSIFKLWIEGGKVSPELTELCRRIDCLSVLSLPALYKNEPAAICEDSGSVNALSLILGASRLSTLEPWAELWLRLAYEHALIYGGGELTEICPMAIDTVSRRKYDEKRSLHLLAFTAYLMRRAPTDELSISYHELDMQSRFDGNPPLCEGEELEQIIRSAVYTCAEREMEVANRSKHLGAVITHVKNRFILECAPVGHGKRGKRHFWRQRISFPKSLGDSEPILKPFVIEEVHNDIARFGAVLRDERCRSQIICRSELILDEEPHPFIADLVLDIAYISSVKCDTMEICIKDGIADGEYYIYDCIIYVY